MTWTLTPVSGHGPSSGSQSICVALRGCSRAGASARLTISGLSTRETISALDSALRCLLRCVAIDARSGGVRQALGALRPKETQTLFTVEIGTFAQMSSFAVCSVLALQSQKISASGA